VSLFLERKASGKERKSAPVGGEPFLGKKSLGKRKLWEREPWEKK